MSENKKKNKKNKTYWEKMSVRENEHDCEVESCQVYIQIRFWSQIGNTRKLAELGELQKINRNSTKKSN